VRENQPDFHTDTHSLSFLYSDIYDFFWREVGFLMRFTERERGRSSKIGCHFDAKTGTEETSLTTGRVLPGRDYTRRLVRTHTRVKRGWRRAVRSNMHSIFCITWSDTDFLMKPNSNQPLLWSSQKNKTRRSNARWSLQISLLFVQHILTSCKW
jgi:hypothetical protein